MNKIYVIGALALASANAAATAGYHFKNTLPTLPLGSFTYSIKTDCLASATATTLGMNNIYHQYYSFTISAGTISVAAGSPVDAAGSSGGGSYDHIYSFNGCYHIHLYNWLATPVIGTAAATAGLATQVVAYGYQLTGTAVTSCANTIVSTLHTVSTGAFTGAAWQTIKAYLTIGVTTPASTSNTSITQNTRLQVGTTGYENLIVSTGKTVSTHSATTPTNGIITASSSNLYWDFMQTQVIQGATQFGRGGGSTTSPCGWYVLYAYEAPGPEVQTTGATTGSSLAESSSSADSQASFSSATVNLWTDNSLAVAASAAVLSLAGLLAF